MVMSMSSNWYLIDRPYYTEGSETNDFEFDRDLGVLDNIADTPLSSEIMLCKGKFDGVHFEIELKTKGIVQSNDSDTTLKTWERQLLMPIGSLSGYQYIKFENSIWLIRTKPENNHIYEKVILSLCNWVAKWQDDDLNIVNKPFFVQNASQYNNGETNINKTLTIGSNQYAVYTAMDNDTLLLSRDKRIFIDYTTEKRNPIPYVLTRNDTVSYSSGDNITDFLIFTEDQFNPQTDRADLMLCDYKEKIEKVKPVEITCNGNSEIRCGGQAKTFAIDTDKDVEWILKTTESQQNNISIVKNGNKVKVKCLNNLSLIGTSFKLVCIIDGEEIEKLIDIVGGV